MVALHYLLSEALPLFLFDLVQHLRLVSGHAPSYGSARRNLGQRLLSLKDDLHQLVTL